MDQPEAFPSVPRSLPDVLIKRESLISGLQVHPPLMRVVVMGVSGFTPIHTPVPPSPGEGG